MSKVYRVYVEKRKEYAVEADEILNDIQTQLNINHIQSLSVVNRYDVQGIEEDVLNQGIPTILSEDIFPLRLHKIIAFSWVSLAILSALL